MRRQGICDDVIKYLTSNRTFNSVILYKLKICITKYKEDYTPLLVESDSLSWINENLPCFIGANSKISEGSFSAYYFFDENLYYALHDHNIENISVRIMFTDDVRPIDGTYQLCYHNFSNLEDAQENFDNKKHILGMFKLTNFDSDHRDIILSRNQIDILKEAKEVKTVLFSLDTETKNETENRRAS